MRLFLRTIYAVAAIALFVACGDTETHSQEPQNNKVEGAFKFSGETINHTSLSVNVIPEDKDQEYLVFISEKKHLTSNNIDNREKLLEDDYLYISGLAESYQMGLRDFLSRVGWLVKGDKMNYGAVNLYPDTEYVVYCYGVEFDGDFYEATTEVCYNVLKTSTPKMIDAKFDTTIEVTGNIATLTIDPKNYNGYYYTYFIADNDNFYLAEGKEFDASFIEHYRNRAYNEFNALINDLGTAVKDFCQKGKSVISERLEPNKGYMAITFAVSDTQTPIMCSVPKPYYFTVGDIAISDFTLDITVTDITSYNAQLSITPSDNDQDYACVMITKDQEPAREGYDQMLAILEYYQPAVFHGPLNEQLGPLMPGTEYVVLAFGIENNMPITNLFRLDFTSTNAATGSITIESIDLVKLFDAEEIIALDGSYANTLAECECIAIVEMKTSKPTDKVYFWWYEGWMGEEYSDEAFLEDLLLYDYSPNPELMDMYYSMSDEDLFFFAGIAEDENGNLSPIYYGDVFTLSKDMCSPAEEFFPYVESRSANTFILRR